MSQYDTLVLDSTCCVCFTCRPTFTRFCTRSSKKTTKTPFPSAIQVTAVGLLYYRSKMFNKDNGRKINLRSHQRRGEKKRCYHVLRAEEKRSVGECLGGRREDSYITFRPRSGSM